MSLILQDSNLQIWDVSATTGGQTTTTPSVGVPQVLYLVDRNNAVWLLGISTLGLLTTTVALATSHPQFTAVNLTASWSLQVNTQGLLQTFPAWVPNGGGAGTDNRVVGGGGGYMAYPQPPTGPRAALYPPDKNGQFGPLAITVNNGTGVWFQISNPGRSTNQ